MFTDYHNGKTTVGFKPYRGKYARLGKGGFVQINLAPWGLIWASLKEYPFEAQKFLGEKYFVEILGWGSQPGYFWNDLSIEQQELLLTTL